MKKGLVNSHPGNITKSVSGGSEEGKLQAIIYGNGERNSNRNLEAGAESEAMEEFCLLACNCGLLSYLPYIPRASLARMTQPPQ